MIVMEPGDTLARLRDIRVEDGDPRHLQEVVGGYVDAHPLGHDLYLYVPEDPEGRAVNHMATDLIKVAPTRQASAFGPLAGFQQTIYGTAVLVHADPTTGQEQRPNQKAYDMLAEAGIDIAVQLSNGTELSTNVKGGITDLVFQRAKDGARTINSFALIPDFLLHLRDQKIAQSFDEEAIREMLRDWLKTGRAYEQGASPSARLQRQIEVIAQQASSAAEARVLRARLRDIAEDEIAKLEGEDTASRFRVAVEDKPDRPGSIWDVPARVGYGKDWEQSTKDTYRGDVTDMIRKMQGKDQ